MTIAQKVLAAQAELATCNGPKELREWAIKNGMDNRSAFPKFKTALLSIGIDYDGQKDAANQARKDGLEASITHELTLFSDAKDSLNRFGITDENGNPLWHGTFFDGTQHQAAAELEAAKKAVWLAGKVKEAVNATGLRLTLNVDAEWLTYQSHAGQKGYVLTVQAEKMGILLNVVWVSGATNPADKFTICKGHRNWKENDLAALAKPISA